MTFLRNLLPPSSEWKMYHEIEVAGCLPQTKLHDVIPQNTGYILTTMTTVNFILLDGDCCKAGFGRGKLGVWD